MRRLLGIVARIEAKKRLPHEIRRRSSVLTAAVIEGFGFEIRLRDCREFAIKRFNRRCLVSNRARGVSGLFRISSMSFKDLVSRGVLTGMRKVGW
jgi:ribosomal protein S14